MTRPEPSTPPTRAPQSAPDVRRILRAAGWLGTVVGVIELGFYAVRTFGLGTWVRLGHHSLWLTPLGNALWFTLLGLVLAAVHRVGPRLFTARVCYISLFFGAAWVLRLAAPWITDRAGLVLSLGLGWQLGRVIASREAGFGRLVDRTLVPLALTVGIVAAGAHFGIRLGERQRVARLPEPAPNAPNVLLVVWDAARALNMSLYGYGRSTTPHLEALAKEAAVFDQAIAPSPWTHPSHASMLTGRFAYELNVEQNVRLDRADSTLAEVLGARGYRSGMFAGNQSYVIPETGIGRGTHRMEAYPLGVEELIASTAIGRRLALNRGLRRRLGLHDILSRFRADAVNRATLDWIGTDARPFFAVVNYIDTHYPYLPPEPFGTRYGPLLPYAAFGTTYAHRGISFPNELKLGKMTAPEAGFANAHDGSLAWVDSETHHLLDRLKAAGKLDNTIVIITADHGDALGEQGRYGHNTDLHYPVLRIPLIIRFPHNVPGGTRIGRAVTTRDLAATVFDLGGLGSSPLPGRSLATAWRADSSSFPATPVFSGFRCYSAKRYELSLVEGTDHFIRDREGREHLFNTALDPLEGNDLAATETGRPRVAAMAARVDSLTRALARSSRAAAARLSAEERPAAERR